MKRLFHQAPPTIVVTDNRRNKERLSCASPSKNVSVQRDYECAQELREGERCGTLPTTLNQFTKMPNILRDSIMKYSRVQKKQGHGQ